MTDTSVFDTGTSGVPNIYYGGDGYGNYVTPGATDYSGTYNDPYNPADPMNFVTGGYAGGYSSGLVDASGQSIPQVMSEDPGNQLSQDQSSQQPSQQPVAQAGAGMPVSGIPLVAQPSGLSNLVNQLVGGGANPWMLGTGARQSPQVPVPSAQEMQGAKDLLGSQLAARYPQPTPPPAPPEPAPAPTPTPAPTAAAAVPVPAPRPAAADEDSTDEGPQKTRTPETAPPAPQARPQQRYPQSPLQGFIDQLLGAMGLRPPIATQGPYAGRPINQIPWATPQQYQQYQRTGQFPQAVDPRTGMAPGFSRDAQGRPTYKGQPPDMHLGGGPNGASQPAWSPEAIRRGDDAERNAQQGGVFGAPPTNQGQARQGAAPATTGTPYLYAGNAPGAAHPWAGGAATPSNANFAGTQQPTAYDRWANQGGTGTPPSQQPAGARFQVPPGASAQQRMQTGVANTMAAGGMSNNAIAGIFQNIVDESHWNPAERDRDQDKYMAKNPGAPEEARYAHGLYQEGGPDWPLFQRFLNGRDWRDPNLQTQFMMQHMRQRSPAAWQRMNNARTPGEAAAIFVHEYLRPAPQYEQARTSRYLGRGVPSLQQIGIS